MNSLAKAVAAYLDTLGVGEFAGNGPGWTIAYAGEPASPDKAITVYDTGGGEPTADIEFYQSTIQIRVRAVDYDDAYGKQQEIRDILIGTPTHELDDTLVIGFWNSSDITGIGRDENRRLITTANYRTIRQPLEGAST